MVDIRARRTGLSGGRKILFGLSAILAIAGVAYWGRHTPTAIAGGTPAVTVRTVQVTEGTLNQTLRLTGTIEAERAQIIQAPQMLGIRGQGHVVGNVSSTATPSSTPTFSPSSSSSALRGGSNRYGDKQVSRPVPSTPYTPPSSAGSVYSSLPTSQSLRGSGDSDFNLTILRLAAPGSRVRKGDIIAEFDRQTQMLRLDDYRDTVTQLDANLMKMRSDLTAALKARRHILFAAKSDVEKAELDLKTAPVRSAIQVEKLQLALDEARARYDQLQKETALVEQSQSSQIHAAQIDRDQAKMELDRARGNVELMLVRAPMNGIVVLQSIYRGGDMGPAQQGDQLYSGRAFMEVIDPSFMLLNARINQVDAERVKIGMKVKVHLDAYATAEYPGHVVGVNALAKTSSRRPNFIGEIDVRIKLDSIDEHVIADISGSADVVLAEVDNSAVVPRTAVFVDPASGKPFVYRQAGENWEKREVTLGMSNNTHYAVRAGVATGDLLALTPPPEKKR